MGAMMERNLYVVLFEIECHPQYINEIVGNLEMAARRVMKDEYGRMEDWDVELREER